MPPPSEAMHRYHIIDRCLTNSYQTYPSMEKLIAEIKKELGYSVSKETIQKDIAHMKRPLKEGGFEAPIKFSKLNNGYYYNPEIDPDYTIRKFGLNEKSLEIIEVAAGVLKRFKGIMASDSFNQTLNHLYASLNMERTAQSKELGNIILPQDTTYLRGMESFDIFVSAIRNKRPISFVHYSYQSQIFKANIIHPYLLKESNNRWYLVGYSEEHKELRYFGIDRIYDPLIINKRFIENKDGDLTTLFSNKIGLNTVRGRDAYKHENIKIWISRNLSNYFKSMPIHHTQKIDEPDGNGDIIISLELVPTYELISLVLSYGTNAELLEPKWLRKEIEKELKHTTSKYTQK